MAHKKSKDAGAAGGKQPSLPGANVPRGAAAIEAERYAELLADLESKKDMLVNQSEKVVKAMKATGQRTLSITDDAGYKHTFAVIDTQEKLRHTKRIEE